MFETHGNVEHKKREQCRSNVIVVSRARRQSSVRSRPYVRYQIYKSMLDAEQNREYSTQYYVQCILLAALLHHQHQHYTYLRPYTLRWQFVLVVNDEAEEICASISKVRTCCNENKPTLFCKQQQVRMCKLGITL